MTTFSAGQVVTAAELETAILPGTVIKRARRDTNSSPSTSATLVPVLRLDGVALTAGRLYGIQTSQLALDANAANDVMRAEIRYDTTGSAATIASARLPGSMAQALQANTSQSEDVTINTTYAPASNQTVSFLLCLSHPVATGATNATILADGDFNTIQILVIDLGLDPGDTGVDL